MTTGCQLVSDNKFSESWSNYNALKVFRNKPLCDIFSDWNELSMNLGQIFDKFLEIMQESFAFSFSELFADDRSQIELICLLV